MIIFIIAAFVFICVCAFSALWWLLSKSSDVITQLSEIEDIVNNANTTEELDIALERLNKITLFHRSHYLKSDSVFYLLRVKHKKLKNKTN